MPDAEPLLGRSSDLPIIVERQRRLESDGYEQELDTMAARRHPVILFMLDLLTFWKSIVVIVTPLIFLPLVYSVGTKEARCAYVVIVMAVFWMLEVVPLAITAFLPLFMFPLFGVMPVGLTAKNYLKDTNFLFFGGLMVALAVEQSNLHKRLALRVLLLVGAQPRWLMLGFMSVTCFLSMWISNTATTAMMVPIAIAVLEELVVHDKPRGEDSRVTLLASQRQSESEIPPDQEGSSNSEDSTHLTPKEKEATAVNGEKQIEAEEYERQNTVVTFNNTADSVLMPQVSVVDGEAAPVNQDPDPLHLDHLSKEQAGMCKAILLSICYAANFGGTGTLTGTGPNLVLRGQLNTIYKGANTGISFASWMPFAIPPMIFTMILGWLLLQLCFFGWRNVLSIFTCGRGTGGPSQSETKNVEAVLSRKYREMGAMTFAEGSVLFWFLLLVVLWIFREPRFMPGWSEFFNKGYVSDGSSAMLIGCIMFVWPNKLPDFCCWRRGYRRNNRADVRQSLLTWPAMQKKFPWAVIMLLGGGFALADGVGRSGLSKLVGCSVQHSMSGVSPAGVIAVFTTLITFLTEVSSNTATASIFIPILISIAENLHVNPLYFALPATISPSFAFMLPVATPPNAIVYEAKIVKITDMMWVGFFMNIICIIVTIINVNTYAYWMFDMSEFPDWANTAVNGTSSCA